MKRCFLVLGPESSGTRLMTRILMAAGCAGSAEHFEQPFDSHIPKDGPDLAVWRRSVPHNREWPAIAGLVSRLRRRGYATQAVVMTRDWYPMVHSQLKAGHVDSLGAADRNLQWAYPHIFQGLATSEIPFVVVSFEGLTLYTRPTLRELLRALDLPAPDDLEVIYDANAKWYSR